MQHAHITARSGGRRRDAIAQQRHEIGKLPALGYNTWNDVRCGVDAAAILSLARGLVQSNFSQKGYTFLNVDDCWQARC